MNPNNRTKLEDRVVRAAEAALKSQGHVSCIDVLAGIGWLEAGALKGWQQGQVDCLEAVVQTNLPRMSEALKLFRAWATQKGLLASETRYVARTPQRHQLRFSRTGDHTVEQLYRTHWVSPALSAKKRERVIEQANRPPELVVIQPSNDTWMCHRCGHHGDLLIVENPGPACLRCAGLDDLEFLPAGDALLSRRAKAQSARFAVVVRFSRNRGRYERQGLLVEAQALAGAKREIEASQSA